MPRTSNHKRTDGDERERGEDDRDDEHPAPAPSPQPFALADRPPLDRDQHGPV